MSRGPQQEIKMSNYHVSANGTVFGTYEAATEQEARDLCAQDAGYKSEADMVKQIEQPSDLAAVEVAFSVGDRVEAGEGEDHDTGRVESIEGNAACVAWDSGVKTPANLSALRQL
jgi:hypothetical protein